MNDVLTIKELLAYLNDKCELLGENTKIMFDDGLENKKYPIKRAYISYDSENGVSINLSGTNI